MVYIGQKVNQIFNRYDKNHDGVISIRGRFHRRENKAQESRTTRGYYQDTVHTTHYDNSQLFRRADSNYDGQVTRRELRRYIRSYDRNGNRELDSHRRGHYGRRPSELTLFNRENRETSHTTTRTIHHRRPRRPFDPFPGHPFPAPGWPRRPHHGPPSWPQPPFPGGRRPGRPYKPPHHSHPYKPPHHTHPHRHGHGVRVRAYAGGSIGFSVKIK